MSWMTRRHALAAIGAAALAGCTDQDLAGRKKPPKGGIGGTGIVGTLTDFGSLIVNGLRVEVAADFPVTSAFGPIRPADLAIGQQVTVEAAGEAGTLIARRVHLTHPVVGRLVAAPGGLLRVAGVLVVLEPGAIVAARSGETVAVSGLWRRDRVVASRIDRVRSGQDAVAGTLRRDPATGTWSIGSLPVVLPPDAMPQDEGYATAAGRVEGGALRAAKLDQGRFTGAAGPLVALSVEGYLAPTDAAPFHTVDGLGHSFAPETRLDPYLGQRTLFRGGYDGLFVLQEGIALAEDLARRRVQIRAMLGG